MPSNEERREVAAKLRSLKFTFEDDLEDELSAFYDALECNPRQKRWETNPYWFLANLIEPEERTCQRVWTPSSMYICSKCSWFLSQPVNFCPNCGAKVVE